MRRTRAFAAVLLIITFIAGAAGCAEGKSPSSALSAKAVDLTDGFKPKSVNGRLADDSFTASMADFSIELFKKSISDTENSLISPTSVMFALAMTANGADGETLAQMEALLGGGIPLDELNEYLYTYADGLPNEEKSKLSIANSIWFRDDEGQFQLAPGFLQKNADYYSAAAYSSAFDGQTIKDINSWVRAKTDGMIDDILNEDEPISPDTVVYLINAVAFDAEWLGPYYEHNVRNGDFTGIDGVSRNVDFMYSGESIYLDDGAAIGFMKPYFGGYSFAALVPNEDVPIEAYIKSLTGGRFLEILSNAQRTIVDAYMPKFEFEYAIRMNDALIALGMPDAFDMLKADFSNMEIDQESLLFIAEVLHKTYISVDELGTKAGAATMVAMPSGAAPPSEAKTVRLDRPFIFAIVDGATNLPVFIGTVMSLG